MFVLSFFLVDEKQSSADSCAHDSKSDTSSELQKMGTGKNAWWKLGQYTSSGPVKRDILFGLKTHRGQSRVGLVFYDKQNDDKIGRVLLQNEPFKSCIERSTSPPKYSMFKGMEVSPKRRGEGWTKVFIAIWLRVCLETGTYPRVGIMRKPLLSHVLGSFGFLPQAGGTPAELLRASDKTKLAADGTPNLTLFSNDISLRGLLSNRDCRNQNITILDSTPPEYSPEHSTTIYLVTAFEHPWAVLDGVVKHQTSKRGSFILKDSPEEQRQLLDDKTLSALGLSEPDSLLALYFDKTLKW